jgi:hypothetical protein
MSLGVRGEMDVEAAREKARVIKQHRAETWAQFLGQGSYQHHLVIRDVA